jgi:hypothetical protein
MAGLEPFAEPLGPAGLGCRDEVLSPPQFPSYAVALEQLSESPKRLTDRLAFGEYYPNPHLDASCTADAVPVESVSAALCGSTPTG